MIDPKDSEKTGTSLSRREFLGTTAAAAGAAAGMLIVPRRVLGGPGYAAPSDTLNIGCVGVGGKGTSDVWAASTENIVALCDVDDTQLAGFMTNKGNKPEYQPKYEKAVKYRDFRQMLDKEKSLDAITVSTPDHTHAVIAMTAMKMGKHVFVQKPLTHTIKEARLLAEFEYDRQSLGNRERRGQLTQQIMRAFEPEIRQHADQWFHFVPIWPAPSAAESSGVPSPP